MFRRWMVMIGLLMMAACTEDSSEEKPEETETISEEQNTVEEETGETVEIARAAIDMMQDSAESLENYYLHTQLTVTIEENEAVTETEEWHYIKDGIPYMRKEVTSDSMPTQYIVMDAERTLQYNEGEEVAYSSDNLSGGLGEVPMRSVISERMEAYEMTHEVTLGGEEELLGHTASHLTFAPKAEENAEVSGTTMDVWIDTDHGLVLKEIMVQEGHRMEYEVVEFNGDIGYNPDLFTLDLPDHVQIIDLTNPEDSEPENSF